MPEPSAPTACPDMHGAVPDDVPDLARRFGGVARLYSEEAARRLARAHVAVAGLGGVGSWCAEALVRSGVGALTLIDLDQVAESNLNRQVQALGSTVGQSKIQAMAERIGQINPLCRLTLVDDFVTADNVGTLLSGAAGADDAPPLAALADCVDDVPAKIAMILVARARQLPLLVCGGAGGKTQPLALRQGDLSLAANDALLAKVRQVLRREHGYPKGLAGKKNNPKKNNPKRPPRMRVSALWVDEPLRLPAAWQQKGMDDTNTGNVSSNGLNCAGYGSSVMVTASMGLAAAAHIVHWLLEPPTPFANAL